jgi:starch synthase
MQIDLASAVAEDFRQSSTRPQPSQTELIRSIALAASAGGPVMRVLFVSSEIYPLAKTGGLADVSAALPRALAELGVDVHLVLPGYARALAEAADKTVEAELPGPSGESMTRLIAARMPDSGLPVHIVDCPSLFQREGTFYQDPEGRDWPDNAQRFAHFTRAAAAIATGELVAGWRADVVHANDWHTGLLPLLLGDEIEQRPRTLFTIHNLAFQGLFAAATAGALGLPENFLTPDGIEFHGRISFLKAGIRFSDRLTTVSPNYAREILTAEHGCGLDGLLRERAGDLTGILNGVDYTVWGPDADRDLPARFGPNDVSGKAVCKIEVQREFGLTADAGVPLIIWISRITDQKMADVALEVLPEVLTRNTQVAILGQGDTHLESGFRRLAERYPGRVAVRISYEEVRAHRLYAGGDLLLHPARFEPCGLTPLYALRYGTIPIVRRVGGLADTIVDVDDETRPDAGTGFAFEAPDGCAMLDCIDRALDAFARPVPWRKMIRRAMVQDFSWEASARRYLAIYRDLAPSASLRGEEEDAELLARRADAREQSRAAA